MTGKRFKLDRSELRDVAQGFGSCIASDRITVDGAPVGYAYRESPDSDLDSGWRFFAGDETQEYADDPGHFALYDVNTIANYDPAIIPFLETPPGHAIERDSSTSYEVIEHTADEDDEER